MDDSSPIGPKPQRGLSDIFLEAVEIEDLPTRAKFLDHACGEDICLRQRVDELLAADEASDGRSVSAINADAVQAETVGTRVGRYKLLQQIGEGGCGIVFMAAQEEPVRRRVALKIIKLGMDTRQVVARFDAERQALALMDHPSIAKVLDAGATDSGRPYFVMELVRGVKITDYADQHRLSAMQRLEIFIQVCQAVQHAHQKGIIHRDLKPSNILVTELDGKPLAKVIDFGIAKAVEGRLTDQTLYTAFEQFLGTPAYMSPEQAAMTAVDVDTRSDVYSLGVLLYELLTGRTPFDTKALLAAGLDEMRLTIREREPLRPSTRLSSLAAADLATVANARQSEAPRLVHLVRGDLDWIVMKCLEKERSRRYETANALAMDLRRHLSSEPVQARPPSKLYEFERTARRHKFGFAATAAIMASLSAGIVLSLLQSNRARQAEAVARRNAYVADMRMVQQTLGEGDLHQSRELLRRYMPQRGGESDLRGWEWRHLAWECRGDEHIALRGFSNAVRNVRFLDNERLLATALGESGGGEDATIWNIKTGAPSLGFIDHVAAGYRSIALSPKRAGLYFTAEYQYETNVYFTKLGGGPESRLDFVGRMERVAAIDISPDERLLAIGSKGEVSLWDIDARTNVARVPLGDDRSWAIRFSPDGKTLAIGDESGQLRFWSVEHHEIFATITNAHTVGTPFTAVEFSPKGRWLASVGLDHLTKVWDTTTRSLVAELPHARTTYAAAFSHDGRWLATVGADDCIRIWETAKWTLSRILRGHTDLVKSVDFSPDDHWLASGSRNGEMKVWPFASEDTGRTELPTQVNVWMNFAPDGHAFARLTAFSVTPREVEIWSLPSFQLRQHIPIHDLDPTEGALLPGGEVLAIACGDGSIHLRSAIGRKEVVATNAHRGRVECVRVTRDGSRMFSVGIDGELRIWQLPQMTAVAQRNIGDWIGNMIVAADGRSLALFHVGGDITIYDLASLRACARWSAFPVAIDCVGAFSPDGRRLAAGGKDGSARIWDTDRGRPTVNLNGLFTSINSMTFSPDGSRLAVGSPDDIRVFDAATGDQMASFKARDAFVVFTEKGDGLLGVSSKGPIEYRAPSLDQLRFEWLTNRGSQNGRRSAR